MKASELRIGNYVCNPGAVPQNQIVIVDIITPHNIEFIFPNAPRTERYYLSYKHLQPIPLTEEWLGKFGFKKEIDFEKEFDGGVISLSAWMEVDVCVGHYVESGSRLPHIKSVHQLQNLYFCLTGEELTIK